MRIKTKQGYLGAITEAGTEYIEMKNKKASPNKPLIQIVETETRIRKTIIADIRREVKERQRKLERDVLALQRAMRGPN